MFTQENKWVPVFTQEYKWVPVFTQEYGQLADGPTRRRLLADV